MGNDHLAGMTVRDTLSPGHGSRWGPGMAAMLQFTELMLHATGYVSPAQKSSTETNKKMRKLVISAFVQESEGST